MLKITTIIILIQCKKIVVFERFVFFVFFASALLFSKHDIARCKRQTVNNMRQKKLHVLLYLIEAQFGSPTISDPDSPMCYGYICGLNWYEDQMIRFFLHWSCGIIIYVLSQNKYMVSLHIINTDLHIFSITSKFTLM